MFGNVWKVRYGNRGRAKMFPAQQHPLEGTSTLDLTGLSQLCMLTSVIFLRISKTLIWKFNGCIDAVQWFYAKNNLRSPWQQRKSHQILNKSFQALGRESVKPYICFKSVYKNLQIMISCHKLSCHPPL